MNAQKPHCQGKDTPNHEMDGCTGHRVWENFQQLLIETATSSIVV